MPTARQAQQAPGPRHDFLWTLGWRDLWMAFEPVGDIVSLELDKAKVGQAIITFSEKDAAERAVSEYDHGTLDGREIRVKFEDDRLNT